MWDNFHRAWIYGFLLICLVTCSGCFNREGETKMVDEMAENCRGGMLNARVHKEDDETDVYVGCK